MKAFLNRLSPSLIVAIALLLWWFLNLVLAGTVELANDEAYYWWWATGYGLDWGYFDHPPAVACLIWLTHWIQGEYGVRLATTILQPLYLFLLWHIWQSFNPKPSKATALVFVALAFSVPLLQLYGLLALPDAPLLFSSTLFLWALLRLWRKPSAINAVIVGVATTLIGYCKYQGIIMVATAFVLYLIHSIRYSTPSARRKVFLYVALWLVTALLLYVPHILWLYKHDWDPLRYHLQERSTLPYKPSFTIEYLINLVVVFNPLLLWFLYKAVRHRKKNCEFQYSLMTWTLLVYILFFFVASIRGRTQPQWTLVAALPLVWLLIDGYNDKFSEKTRKTFRIVLYVSVGVMLCARLFLLFNPLHLKGELWDNRKNCEAIAAMAQDRPVVVLHNYTLPCKYIFYTNREACCIPVYYERDSQWRYTSGDSAYAFKPTLVIVQEWLSDKVVPNTPFHCIEIDRYLPLSRIRIEPVAATTDDTSLYATLHITNPYPYDISPSADNGLQLRLSTMITSRDEANTSSALTDTIPANSTKTVPCCFKLGKMAESIHSKPIRFCIQANGVTPSHNSSPVQLDKIAHE